MGLETCTVCFRDGLEKEYAVALSNGYRHKECERLEDGDYWPFERHDFPNGTVFYRDSTHDYFTEIQPKHQGRGKLKGIVGYTGVRDAQIPSPSAIGKYADPEADKLMGYVLRVEGGDLTDYEKLALKDASALGVNLDQPRYLVLRDAKGAIGTLTHDALDKGLYGQPVPIEDALPSVQPHLIALDRFFADHEIEPLQTEQVVLSTKYGYAGRFDARVKLRAIQGEMFEVAMLDLKTSGFIGRSYHAQIHGYDLAAEECGVGKSDSLLILQTKPDTDYHLWPCRSSRKTFLHCLALHQLGREIDAATKQDFKEMAAA